MLVLICLRRQYDQPMAGTWQIFGRQFWIICSQLYQFGPLVVGACSPPNHLTRGQQLLDFAVLDTYGVVLPLTHLTSTLSTTPAYFYSSLYNLYLL